MVQFVAAARHGYRPATDGIRLDEHRVHLDIRRGDLESGRQSIEKALDDWSLLHPDNGIVRPCHAYVRDEGCSAGENSFVRGSHMGMCAEHGGDTPIQIPPHGLL